MARQEAEKQKQKEDGEEAVRAERGAVGRPPASTAQVGGICNWGIDARCLLHHRRACASTPVSIFVNVDRTNGFRALGCRHPAAPLPLPHFAPPPPSAVVSWCVRCWAGCTEGCHPYPRCYSLCVEPVPLPRCARPGSCPGQESPEPVWSTGVCRRRRLNGRRKQGKEKDTSPP